MNAEEFEAMLRELRRVITNLGHYTRIESPELFDDHIGELRSVLAELESHRLEMRAAERKPPSECEDCETASQSQLAAIEKRLGEIEQKHDGLNAMYHTHLGSLHGIAGIAGIASCFPPPSS